MDELFKINTINSQINEYFFLKTVSWYIFYLLQNNEINKVIEEKNYYVKWIKVKFPNYKKNKYLKLFKSPEGKKSIGLAIYILFKMNYLKFDNLFLKMIKRSNR